MTSPKVEDGNRKWWTLFAVCLGAFMLLLDITIVNVALDSIRVDLGSTFSDLQWVVDAYALGLAALLLTFGSISDIFGRRRMFTLGIVGFTAASLMCALSTGPFMLNIARGVQGVGAAAIFATALALIAQEFHGKDRGAAFGAWGAATGSAVAVGPLVGGALTDAHGWQWIFLVNIPVGILIIALTLWKVPAHIPEKGLIRIDFPGLLTFSSGLFLLIYGLVRGNLDGWGSTRIVACLFLAAVLLLAFVVIELRVKHPMLDMSLFKRPAFIGASAAGFALSASIFSVFLYMTLYLQNVLMYSPWETGLRFLPQSILAFIIAIIAGKASARFSVRGLIGTGLLCVGAGLLWMASSLTETSNYLAFLPGLCLSGFGIGLTNPPLASAAVAVVPAERSGMAGGINSTFRQIGIATGIAGLGAIYQHQVEERVRSGLASALEPADAERVAHGLATGTSNAATDNLSVAVQNVSTQALRLGQVHGLDTILLIAAGIALGGAAVVFLTVRKKDFVSGGHAVD